VGEFWSKIRKIGPTFASRRNIGLKGEILALKGEILLKMAKYLLKKAKFCLKWRNFA